MARKPNELEGKPLILSASIGVEYSNSIKTTMKLMHKELMLGVENCFRTYAQDSGDELPQNGSLVSQLKILINRLLKKYNPVFSILAKKSTERMIERAQKNSAATLKMSLKEISKDLTVKTDLYSESLKNITQAATQESVSLIRSIPQNYLSNVQRVLMHSISTQGKGYAELKPFLTKIYKGNERKAELVALDQTHKVYQSIQTERMKLLGVKKFKWIHSGGGREPRKLHQEMHGKVYSFDNPPYIGDMYGERIYGLPGHLPNCRCTLSPILDFGNEDND